MANVRNLKKDVNFVLGDIIEAVYAWELLNSDKDTAVSQQIIDEAIDVFDQLIEKINQKPADGAKKHFQTIKNELEAEANKLLDKLNKL